MSNKDIHKGLHPDIRQEYKARFLLTQLIMKNPHFKKRANDIKQRYSEVFEEPLNSLLTQKPQEHFGYWDNFGNWTTYPFVDEAHPRVQYFRDVEGLVQEFGLRCKWGPDAIHSMITMHGYYSGPGWWIDERELSILVKVNITSTTKWSDVRKAILDDAKHQFNAAIKPLREDANIPQRDRGTDTLERNVKILYKRICEGLSPLEIWNDDQLKEVPEFGLTVDTIKSIVSKTAKLLGISLR